MYCLFSNIYICGLNELNLLNLSNFTFIINCSKKFNTLIQSPNFLNINEDTFNLKNFELLEQIYQWLEKNYQSRVIILDETGLDNAMLICIYIIMKSSNTSFHLVYDNLNKTIKLREKNHYKILLDCEKQILKNTIFTNIPGNQINPINPINPIIPIIPVNQVNQINQSTQMVYE